MTVVAAARAGGAARLRTALAVALAGLASLDRAASLIAAPAGGIAQAAFSAGPVCRAAPLHAALPFGAYVRTCAAPAFTDSWRRRGRTRPVCMVRHKSSSV